MLGMKVTVVYHLAHLLSTELIILTENNRNALTGKGKSF
jgi:hypothetical protein